MDWAKTAQVFAFGAPCEWQGAVEEIERLFGRRNKRLRRIAKFGAAITVCGSDELLSGLRAEAQAILANMMAAKGRPRDKNAKGR